MCAVVTIFVMVLALAGAVRAREDRIASTALAAIGLYPVGIVLLWITFGAHESSSISEALPFYLLFSLLLGAPIALVLGAMVRPLLKAKASYGPFAVAGSLIGAGISPYHFLLSTGPAASMPVSLYLGVDAVLMALFLPWLLGNLFEEGRLASIWKLAMVATVAFVGLGIYAIPNVAFRSYRLYEPLGSLERIGARRALMFGGTEAQKATLALAHAGDPLMLEKLRKDLLDGHYEPGELSGTAIVVEQMSGDPEVRQVLINMLDASTKAFRATNTFGDEETKIVSLCEDLGKTRDPRAVPYLIRVYRLPTGFINLREAAADALARIGGPEASQFAVKELAHLHPNLNKHLGEILGKMDDPQVKLAMADFGERGSAFQKSQRIKNVPIDSLVQSGDDASLLARALDPRGKDRGKAVIALIKKRHPARVKAALGAISDIFFEGKELQGIDDPELFKALAAQLNLDSKQLDLRIGRFLAAWAPPGSEKTLEQLLFRFSLQDAAGGLGQLGTPQAAKVLIRRLAKIEPTDGSFELYLIRGLGQTKQPIAEKPLLDLLGKPVERPLLISDGDPIYANDVAARALKELGTPKALTAIESYRYQGDPVAVERWWSH